MATCTKPITDAAKAQAAKAQAGERPDPAVVRAQQAELQKTYIACVQHVQQEQQALQTQQAK
jgi:hypothetical protein